MKIATWNVNSIRVRLSQLEKLAIEEKLDIICLQETKVTNNDFPHQSIKDLGYKYIELHGEKAYNGVAILSKIPFEQSFYINFVNDKDKRHVAIKLFNQVEIHNFYVPAGGEIPNPLENPKFKHKLLFMDDVCNWFKQNRSPSDKLILLGDLNIAPLENDVWSHKQLLTEVSHTPIEVEKMKNLYNSLDWQDAIRKFVPENEKLYSWWSYRNRDWEKSDRGRRLDHIWVTAALEKNIKSSYILKKHRGIESPSDHAPVILNIEI
ncbi:MAG: exodeoxyribonuclease III [Pseudomonadota bacterium]